MADGQQTREHWIQRITFTAETNAQDTHTAWRQVSQYLCSLSSGQGNNGSSSSSSIISSVVVKDWLFEDKDKDKDLGSEDEEKDLRSEDEDSNFKCWSTC